MTVAWPTGRVRFLALGALVAIGLALRLRGFAELEFWYDEISLWLDAVSGTPATPLEPPLMAWLLLPFMWAFDTTGPSVIHLVPTVLMVLTIPLAFVAGRLADGQDRTGWIAAVLVTMSPMSIYYSREGRPYALFMLLSGALYVVFLSAHRRNERALWWMSAGVLALCGLTHLLTTQIVVAVAAFALIHAVVVDSGSERHVRLVRGVAFTGLGILAGLSWGVIRYLGSSAAANAMGRSFSGPYRYGVGRYLWTVLVNFGPGPVGATAGDSTTADAIALVCAILFGIGLWRLYAARRMDLLLFASIVFPIPLVITYANVGIASDWDWIRYLSHLLFPFLVVVSVGVQAVLSRLRTRPQRGLVAALLVGAMLPGTMRLQARDDYQQYRDMTAYLAQYAGDLKGVMVLPFTHTTGPADERILNIYYRKKTERLPVYALTDGVIHAARLVQGRVGSYAVEGADPATGLESGTYALLTRVPVTDCRYLKGWIRNGLVARAEPLPDLRVPPVVTLCTLDFLD